jgi:hypothetical protein
MRIRIWKKLGPLGLERDKITKIVVSGVIMDTVKLARLVRARRNAARSNGLVLRRLARLWNGLLVVQEPLDEQCQKMLLMRPRNAHGHLMPMPLPGNGMFTLVIPG